MVTGIVDRTRGPDGKVRARLLDLVEGCSGPVYRSWLTERAEEFCKGIKVAALDLKSRSSAIVVSNGEIEVTTSRRLSVVRAIAAKANRRPR